MQPLVQWFELGGTLKYQDDSSTAEIYAQFKKIQGLLEATRTLGIKSKDDPALLVSRRRIYPRRTLRAEENQPR